MLNTDYSLNKILALGVNDRSTVIWVYKANILKRWSCKPEIEIILYTMTTWIILVTPFLVIITLITVILQRQHLLIVLLSLEIIILRLVLMIITLLNVTWILLVITTLTFGACEARLGLACITAIRRSYGNDHLSSLSTNKC